MTDRVLAQAPDRHYSYDSIAYEFRVGRDTSVHVTETQTYNFSGEYHQGWRNIPKRKIDTLTNVLVYDETAHRPLEYSTRRLEKTDPTSWGKYTTFFENGEYIIEWYYNAQDEVHTWRLEYVLQGALSFYKNHDELYWNLFTEYAVPIGRVEARVILPRELSVEEFKQSQANLYIDPLEPRSPQDSYWSIYPNSPTFQFRHTSVAPGTKITIVAGWPKGVVDTSAYWSHFFLMYWEYVAGGIILVVGLLYSVWRWYRMERKESGRGVVIPQYEPPESLRPAEAEVLLREGISSATWPATLVDLAVRGYIRIQEEKRSQGGVLATSIFVLGLFLVFVKFLNFFLLGELLWALSVVLVAAIVFGMRSKGGLPRITPRQYALHKVNEKSWNDLKEYEREFLSILFHDKDVFSTYEMSQIPSSERSSFFLKMDGLKKCLYDNVEHDTRAYDVTPSHESAYRPVVAVAAVVSIWLFFVGLGNAFSGAPYLFLVSACSLAALTVYYVVKVEARLNREGQILREDWLGFKLYLKTAEGHRLQNLTPETFERYLPYAMIFGVEKQWAKAFDAFSLSAPSWYGGVGSGQVGSGNIVSSRTSFSPTTFVSSFSASFASSFTSTGAGGVSGGGGSAGGGGGGGGGGAS